MNLLYFPVDIFGCFFSFLTYKDVLLLKSTCKYLRQITDYEKVKACNILKKYIKNYIKSRQPLERELLVSLYTFIKLFKTEDQKVQKSLQFGIVCVDGDCYSFIPDSFTNKWLYKIIHDGIDLTQELNVNIKQILLIIHSISKRDIQIVVIYNDNQVSNVKVLFDGTHILKKFY